MAVGPQYQSQLALLAGALSHGLDPTQGYDIYNQTVQAAQAAREQRQQEIQQSLGALSQMAVQAATSGATPEQVGALVHASEAGLPHQGSQAIQHGVHKIMGSLSDYQATPDPMAQAQLQGQLLSNAQAQMDLQSGGADLSSEQGIFGPAHMQTVQNLTTTLLKQGNLSVPDIRNQVLADMSQEFSQTIHVPKTIPGPNGQPVPDPTGATTTVDKVPPPIQQEINKVISDTVANYGGPVAGTGLSGQQWAQQNLVAYMTPAQAQAATAQPSTPPPPPPQAGPPSALGALNDAARSPELQWGGAGAITGAAVGAAGGPFAPLTVPTGAAIGGGIGFLSGLVRDVMTPGGYIR